MLINNKIINFKQINLYKVFYLKKSNLIKLNTIFPFELFLT